MRGEQPSLLSSVDSVYPGVIRVIVKVGGASTVPDFSPGQGLMT